MISIAWVNYESAETDLGYRKKEEGLAPPDYRIAMIWVNDDA